MTIEDIVSIIIAVCAIIGVIISYLELKRKLKKEVITLYKMINSPGAKYYSNCKFYGDIKDTTFMLSEYERDRDAG